MCGIAALIHSHRRYAGHQVSTDRLLKMLRPIAYRGDAEHFGETAVFEDAALGTNRLAIVGREDGRQPVSDAGWRVWAVLNGEIYNFQSLKQRLVEAGRVFRTRTDTEVLVHGYLEWGPERLLQELDGMFAFVLYDRMNGSFLAARDHIGIKPLYYAVVDGTWFFASEQKCLMPFACEIMTLAPGHYILDGEVRCYHRYSDEPLDLPEREMVQRFRELFEEAVRKRVQTDLPVAVTFSGGIDSTVVLHLARKYHPDVTAFTIGFEGASDIGVAERFCKDFSIPHHIAYLSEREMIEALPRVVYEAEFFEGIDVMDTCVGHYVYREIRRHGIKVALCGEGSDEVLAGYDLFREHSDKAALMKYRVANLHRTDLQRVDRSSMMSSVEARVPFLDKDFLGFAYRVPMDLKLRDGVEKWILREAFRGEIPDYVLFRRKVRMPDGTGLQNRLYNHAQQGAPLPDDAVRALGIRTPQEAFFLKHYLDAGFPLPHERFRRPVYDFSEHGYFNFIS
ncbi:MAG TPA: asparagine synthase-related protein [Thermoanaerobaculia bacterium]|nr:asparagine synthase-related protein [Thermoanaerobaculia bacterium]